MMDQIAGLVARGLISPDAAQGLVQQVNDIRNKPSGIGSVPLEGGSPGMGPPGGASGRSVMAPDYGSALQRDVIDRGRRGRPTATKQLPIGNEQKILDRSEKRLSEGPRVVSSKEEQDAILRKNWEENGPERDYDWDNFRTWEREIPIWNKEHPDNPMPSVNENYTFGQNKEFEKYFDAKHLEGKKKPYPGARAANEYFADDPDTHHLTAFTSRRQMNNVNEDLLPPEMQK